MVLFCFFPSSFPFQLWLEINFNQVVGASVSIRAQTRHVVHANSSVYLPTVVLAWRRSGAGCTYEEPGSGEPDSSQRCVSEREIEIERGWGVFLFFSLQNIYLLLPWFCLLVVATMREALQKLEVRVAVLEKSPAPTAAKVEDCQPLRFLHISMLTRGGNRPRHLGV